MNDQKKCDNRMYISTYMYEHPEQREIMTIPPMRRDPHRSGLDDNIHNEIMTCGNCAHIAKSGRYKGLVYCSMGVAAGCKQRECPVDPSGPGCDWWTSTIPVTKKELDRLHRLMSGLPRDH